jgi:hypothetical protein
MPTSHFNPEACQARNRRSALRGGISAAPVTLGAAVALTEGEALTLINAMQVGGEALTAEQVHIRYAEAANGNYIPSRAMFLADSTLDNIAEGAGAGVAFMNSHRTGGFSTPSELPFGQTFWGSRDRATGRALVGVWMLRGISPNGANGPTTDALAAMIDAGTLRDVSVGLYGGQALCDLCGKVVDEWEADACQHVPGTTHGMSLEQQATQQRRGVPDGCASYSLHNARFGEVSAVFDGAVPGAGFRKALSLAAKGELTLAELGQARSAYVALARDTDFREITPATIQELAQALQALWSDEGDEEAPTTSSFSDHSHLALTTVEEYLARSERYDALRESQGRPAASARFDEWQALHARLTALLARSAPKADPALVQALRVRHLQRQARRRENAGAGSLQ